MGYTHYYSVIEPDSEKWQATWPRLIQDAYLVLEASDVLVYGPRGDNEDAELLPPLVDIDEGICFNGVADDGHEAFYLDQNLQSAFVKTLRKPYDLPVACLLLRAHLLAPEHFEVFSDGFWDDSQWVTARRLYEELWPGQPICCPWEENEAESEEDAEDDLSEDVVSTEPKQDQKSPANTEGNTLSPAFNALAIQETGSRPGPLRSTVANVDYTHIRHWLTHCEEDGDCHRECKASPIKWRNLPGIRFKVIDVQQQRIVNAPDDCSFVALTYVWGGISQPKLTQETAPLLMNDGGLRAIWEKIPTTVRDAIEVCQKLGEKYLWVDALCIIQDSAQDMKIQILRMRDIYSAAKCTIAAVSAETAEEGLLGSSPSTSLPSCDSLQSLEAFTNSSPWSTRAWCYQEKVLSHRMILFTSNGVYMQCQTRLCNSEGSDLRLPERNDERNNTFNTVGAMLSVPTGQDQLSFFSAVEHFSERKLTKAEDKMNAFQGIMKRYKGSMDGAYSTFYYGLPISGFDQAFCWRSDHHTTLRRNSAFPSWSWLGWDGAVKFDRSMTKAMRTSQMIHGYDEYSQDASIELRQPASSHSNRFGFPGSNGPFANSPECHISASISDLRIAQDPVESDGPNGLYPVFPLQCTRRPDTPPSKGMTLLDFLTQPLPQPKYMDKKTAAAPSVPGIRQTSKDYNSAEHDAHPDCIAQRPLGCIWLDREWRARQPDHCVMEFMALSGERQSQSERKWRTTMLMCLQRMEKNGHFWASERMQVMDCNIDEDQWLETGARIKMMKLT